MKIHIAPDKRFREPDSCVYGEKGEFEPMSEEILFYIICPCNCGRAIELKIEDFPAHSHEKVVQGIPETGNRIWQCLVDAKGLEGAIQFLHERTESA